MRPAPEAMKPSAAQWRKILIAAQLLMVSGCSGITTTSPPLTFASFPRAPSSQVSSGPPSGPPARVVMVSWYGPGFVGRKTSSGEPYSSYRLTAASTTLPLGSIVHLTNVDNGRSVDVRINDCGPHVRGRSLDVSQRAAQKLRIKHKGVGRVKITNIRTPSNAGESCHI